MTVFGFWIFEQIRRLHSGADPDCFIRFGAFSLCDATQNLSIYSNMFLLMAQALISRILVPGMSIFVSASVRRLLLRRYLVMFESLTHHILQILDSSSDRITIHRTCSVDCTVAPSST